MPAAIPKAQAAGEFTLAVGWSYPSAVQHQSPACDLLAHRQSRNPSPIPEAPVVCPMKRKSTDDLHDGDDAGRSLFKRARLDLDGTFFVIYC